MALIAELHLRCPQTDRGPSARCTPQRKKEKTFEALLRQAEGLAHQQPVLMMFDDLHWIDPSSRELLDRHDRAGGGLAGAAAGNVPPRVSAAMDRAAACDDADAGPARPDPYGGNDCKCCRRGLALTRDRGGDRRTHRWRAAVRRGTDLGGAGGQRPGRSGAVQRCRIRRSRCRRRCMLR